MKKSLKEVMNTNPLDEILEMLPLGQINVKNFLSALDIRDMHEMMDNGPFPDLLSIIQQFDGIAVCEDCEWEGYNGVVLSFINHPTDIQWRVRYLLHFDDDSVYWVLDDKWQEFIDKGIDPYALI